MDARDSMSPLAGGLMVVAAAAFGLLGLVLFVAPAWSAASFPWKISPLVAMTMGGWYLGSAALAGLVAYHRRWSRVYASVLYVGVFAASEIAVLVVHHAKLILAAPLAGPYVGMLALAILASAGALSDRLRHPAAIADEGAPAPRWVRGVIVAFVLFVFFLSGVALSGHPVGLDGAIFPEPLTLFTLRSFGAFYFSLACSAVAVLPARRLAAITAHAQGGLVLIALITIAALAYLPAFRFAEHPLHWIYLGVYLLALVVVVYFLWTQRGRRA